MNRSQRSAHALLWPLLALALLVVSAAAFMAKSRVDRAAIEAIAAHAEED